MDRVLLRWMALAMVGVVLGGSALAAALTTDNRDYAARQTAAAVRSCAL